jgi:cytochrome c oxidase cbb3-type subunit 3
MRTDDKNASNPQESEIHEIDGIVELDLPPPFWWQALFYISIVWGLGYTAYYLLGDGPTVREQLTAKLMKLELNRSQSKKSPEEEAKELLAVLSDPAKVQQGKAIYAKNCASCHGDNAKGGIGPNLADGTWLHGDGSPAAILKVVREGVAEKGMPPWGSLLKDEETLMVSAYVSTLNGKR